VIKTGFYSRIFLPEEGAVMQQDNLTMQALDIMRDHYHHRQFEKIKK